MDNTIKLNTEAYNDLLRQIMTAKMQLQQIHNITTKTQFELAEVKYANCDVSSLADSCTQIDAQLMSLVDQLQNYNSEIKNWDKTYQQKLDNLTDAIRIAPTNVNDNPSIGKAFQFSDIVSMYQSKIKFNPEKYIDSILKSDQHLSNGLLTKSEEEYYKNLILNSDSNYLEILQEIEQLTNQRKQEIIDYLNEKNSQDVNNPYYTLDEIDLINGVMTLQYEKIIDYQADQVKDQIYLNRLSDTYTILDVDGSPLEIKTLKDDPSALAIMRIELGDKYFTSAELKKSQGLIDDYNNYKDKYPNFPIIIGKNYIKYTDETDIVKDDVFIGGDQSWYAYNGHYTAELGGCGPTSATNMFANMALLNEEVAEKLGVSNWYNSRVATQGEYLELMEDVYQTVTPIELPYANTFDEKTARGEEVKGLGGIPSIGVFNNNTYRNKVIQYASEKGISLKAGSFDKFIHGPYDYNELETYLNNGNTVSFLDTISPITMTKINNSTNQKTSTTTTLSRHWVSVLKIDGDDIYISSWGKEYTVSKKDLENHWNWNPTQSLNGMSYFEVE